MASGIAMGYRAFDTAEAYRNEQIVGSAVKDSIAKGLVTREEIFLATKLSDSAAHGGYEKVHCTPLPLMLLDFIPMGIS